MSSSSFEMEDVKPSISKSYSQFVVDGALEVRFTELCKTMPSIDENTCSQAMNLLNESKHLLLANMSAIGGGMPEEIERFWFAFILYSVKRLSEGKTVKENQESDVKGLTLCQILRATKLSIVDFFKEMPQFNLKVGPVLKKLYGADWEKRLEAKELQTNFVHLTLLSKYYKRVYGEFFLTSVADSDKKQAVASITGNVSNYQRFGWLLFLALRAHAFSSFKDLVTCTNGLVSILAILILHVPLCFRNFCVHESPRFVRRGDKGVDLLGSLCDMYDTSEDELRKTIDKANNLIIKILKKKPRLASDCRTKNLDNIDTDGLTYFEDLMEDSSSLSTSLIILEKDYDDAVHNKGELDERVFVNDEDSLLGSGSLSGGAINICGSKRKFDAIASPSKTITSPASPLRSPAASPANGNLLVANVKVAAATPVSTAMTTAKWLRTVISPLPSKPSSELERFLSSCGRAVLNDVIRRAHIISKAIFPSNTIGERCLAENPQNANMMDSIWAEERRGEALKLYYRVLEAMCKAEAQILHVSNLTSLLSNERFHRCMLACSAQLVLATHKTITVLFPAVLQRTGITAFDLSKVIESFIRHEDTLPRELRRHLNSLEERLLESMVWEKGSSMYNSLIVARPALSAEVNHLGLLAEPMPSLDAISTHTNISYGGFPSLSLFRKPETSLGQNGAIQSPKRVCGDSRSVLVERNSFTSPVKDCLLACNSLKPKFPAPPLQSAFASPTRPNPGGGGETYAETGINIFFSKIVKLAAVRINDLVERLQLSQQVRETVYCLLQQILSRRTALFFNRHIDQIILCSFYGVAKISQLSLTFREIIHNYRKQPQCKPQVFRYVFIDWSSTCRNGKTGQEYVDIIAFYNEIFVPSVKPLLVELGPIATLKSKQPPEAKNNVDAGQCPGSPMLPPFPSLPDMSPKKVSATHNVYVSPLRSSKMDALITQTSRSYYACVGESTHAYQSPSKDLTAINNRLNGKKVIAKLNFDDVGMVSDSLVMGILYRQNGSCAASSPAAAATATASNSPLKSQQPNS
ncbi:Retinoblastoma-associated protein [Macleaya cordata]|uniref:Retinoblastoma-associated protein n=1 Tax=Macleaya cordata TaxID=56857 RepID=A0A200R3Q4_MACCD|nr:Retinoblastoma-associated protein [Macleaya cordata]